MDYLAFGECKPMRLLPKLIDNEPAVPRGARLAAAAIAAGNSNATQPHASVDDLSSTKSSITPKVLKRTCNVDVDPKNISDRTEWATAQYHAYYNPHCLFELEIRWLVATSCLLGDLITNWSQRTGMILTSNQVAFHLIPIPCDPFAKFDPLRGSRIVDAFERNPSCVLGSIYIKMDCSCLHDELASLPVENQVLKMNIFQELILKRSVRESAFVCICCSACLSATASF